ncbi:MAG TPA: GWxTD domain-containing protein [Candidatus Polarisedimenticolia bacterium]
MDGRARRSVGGGRWAGPAAVLVAALFAMAAARRAAPNADDYDKPVEGWREGPVRYLLGKDDDDAFRALANDDERRAFILKFWSSRDPQLGTPQNEYRDLFYRRVAEANRFFVESPKAGWKTDRGKIYVLLGPPDEQEPIGDPIFGREGFSWTYRDPPSVGGPGMHSAIRFVKDATGEFHLSNDGSIAGGFESSLGLVFQVQAMQMKSLPEPRVMLDSIVSSRSFVDSVPFRTHRDFFRSVDGNTFVALTVGVRQSLVQSGLPSGSEPAPGAPPTSVSTDGAAATSGSGGEPQRAPGPAANGERFEVLARLVGDDPHLPTYDLAGSDGLRAARDDASSGEDAYLLYQGITTVKPGNYTAYYGVVDRSAAQVYSFKEAIAVPNLKSATLSLSSVTLASRLERVTDGSDAGYTTPFILGNLRVLPRPDDLFHNGETLAFYYQIYSAASDPIDGRPDLEVEYQFFVARSLDNTGQPVFETLGKPIRLTRQQNQVQGYSFPLKDWPAATYRLQVMVKDNLSGRRSSRDVTFRVL